MNEVKLKINLQNIYIRIRVSDIIYTFFTSFNILHH